MDQARLSKLEDKIGDIAVDQAACKQHMSQMCETLTMLADVRAETLHIMKVQENNVRDHDEIFQRLRTVETERAGCSASRKTDSGKIKDLENNQRWVAISVIGTIILIGLKMMMKG